MFNLVGTGRARTSNLLDEEIVTACRKRFELSNESQEPCLIYKGLWVITRFPRGDAEWRTGNLTGSQIPL